MTKSLLISFGILTFAVLAGAIRGEGITLAMGSQGVVLPVVAYRLLTKPDERKRYAPLFLASAVFAWAELVTVDLWASNVTAGAINYLHLGGPISWAGESVHGYPATIFQMPFGWWATIFFLVYLARRVYDRLAGRWSNSLIALLSALLVAAVMGVNGVFWEVAADAARCWVWMPNTAYLPWGLVPVYVGIFYGPGLVPLLFLAVRHDDREELSLVERTLRWAGVLLLGLAIIFAVTMIAYVSFDFLYTHGSWPWDGSSRPEWLVEFLK